MRKTEPTEKFPERSESKVKRPSKAKSTNGQKTKTANKVKKLCANGMVIVVALVFGVPLSVWMYTRAFRRVYIGQDAMVTITQYTRLDAAIAFVVTLYLLSPI
jgi:hypothetical protein